jgi:hypothetical protein
MAPFWMSGSKRPLLSVSASQFSLYIYNGSSGLLFRLRFRGLLWGVFEMVEVSNFVENRIDLF